METTILKCKQCKSPLEYNEESPILQCPHCGCTELIKETDDITKERIRAKTYKDIELGKKNIEKEVETENHHFEIEKRKLSIRWVETICVVLCVMLLVGLIYNSVQKKKHVDDIRIPQASGDYLDKDYLDTIGLLEDAGFANIETVEVPDLRKEYLSQVGKVTQISVNGRITFAQGIWFPKDATIKITYHVLDPAHAEDVKIPCSSYSCSDKDYKTILSQFKNEGFVNIILEPAYKTLGQKDFEKGKIQGVSINGESFSAGVWVSSDVEVRIVYCAEKTSFTGKDYQEAERILREIGFSNIVTEPLEDLKSDKQRRNDDVESVTIDGVNFSEVPSYNVNAEVAITYHSVTIPTDNMIAMDAASKDYIGKDYSAIKEELSLRGFTNIKVEPLSDLKKGWLYRDGAIKSITIDGQEKFKANEYFDKAAEIVITYHSFK